MSENTTALQLPYPAESDTPDVPRDIKNLAARLDVVTLGYLQGTHAARPTSGVANRIYKETDTGLIFHDTGATWEQLQRVADISTPQNFSLSWAVPQVVSNVRPGSLVEWRGMVGCHVANNNEGSMELEIKRNGVQMANSTHGFGNNTAVSMGVWIGFVDAVGGASVTYEVAIRVYGTSASVAPEGPSILTVGP